MNITVRDLCFSYDERMILNHISFDVPEHSVFTVLGPNGAGKTTLLKVMLAFEKMTGGQVMYDGIPLDKLKEKEFRKKAAYVPQAKHSVFPLSVEETVLTGRTGYHSMFEQPDRHDHQIVQKAMEQAGIIHLAGRNCSTLSGGELQLVYIARALCAQPEVIFLDEPETGLDFENQLMVLNLIHEMKKSGMTVVFNTHYPDHALDYSDHTLLLSRDGSAVTGSSKEVLTEENMRRAFHVNVKIFEDGNRHSVIPLERTETI